MIGLIRSLLHPLIGDPFKSIMAAHPRGWRHECWLVFLAWLMAISRCESRQD